MMGNPLQKALRVSDEGNANLLRASAWMCAFRLAAFLTFFSLSFEYPLKGPPEAVSSILETLFSSLPLRH